MAILICNMTDCVYRSKRKLKSWIGPSGAPCYGCAREFTWVGKVFDVDGDIEVVAGKENTAICKGYTPKEEMIP